MPFRKKRREPPIQVKGVLIFFLLVIALCIYTFYVLTPSPEKGKHAYIPHPKPKIPSRLKIKDYTSSCRQVNQLLLSSCKNMGVHEKDFQIQKERPFQTGDKRWVYTEVEIFLPEGVDPTTAAKNIGEGLKNFPTFSSKWEEKAENQVSLSIWLDKILTHSLTFIHRPPQLAIIIDDIGEDVKIIKEFLDLGIPLTFSILPDLPYSKESEELAHKQGYEVMLHLPMEPKNPSLHHPGEGAIFSSMSENEIYETVRRDIGKFNYIKGVNNHMGSRVTENEKTMRSVLNALKSTELYFIDSLTTPRSKAYKIAQEMGIPSGERAIFIDNEPEVNYSKNFLDKAIKQVKKEGKAIAIGHPRETTLKALKEMTPKLKNEGISLVFVSDLVL